MEEYKWIVIGVIVVILALAFMILFRQQIAAVLNRATRIKTKGNN